MGLSYFKQSSFFFRLGQEVVGFHIFWPNTLVNSYLCNAKCFEDQTGLIQTNKSDKSSNRAKFKFYTLQETCLSVNLNSAKESGEKH